MIMLKLLILTLVFGTSLSIGLFIARRYINREKELKDMKNALNMFETKIKFTYASIPEIFEEIGKQFGEEVIGQIFQKASALMKDKSAGTAWREGIEEIESSMTIEDKTILMNLGKMLGKTDIEGQVSEIKLVTNFLDTQIRLAEKDRRKNEKLYRTLGGVIGLTLVIILI